MRYLPLLCVTREDMVETAACGMTDRLFFSYSLLAGVPTSQLHPVLRLTNAIQRGTTDAPYFRRMPTQGSINSTFTLGQGVSHVMDHEEE